MTTGLISKGSVNMDLLEKVINKAKTFPAKSASQVVFWGFIILILYLSAQITWKLFPASSNVMPWSPMSMNISNQGQTSFDLLGVKKLSLFGDPKSDDKLIKPIEIITDAPKTSLSIQLTGVVASTSEQHGLAIIDSGGRQNTYGLGEKIKGTSATLKEVYADRVIIANAGRYETLMLDGLKYTPGGVTSNKISQGKITKVDKRSNQKVSHDIEMYRDEILQNPGKITDFISISPVRGGDGTIGYRLNPGKDRQFFRAAGLKPGDLAKSINGYDLTDMNQAIEIMGQLPELAEASVMVERQGQLVEILFSLPR